ncbi:acylphosphatase [Paludifilum halophilum]|uniref:Acylphosphatase n=1 Tax=Paludifilum halophilum TaxID=1642702 RepID=A0A235BBS6_9BACL|nr:acylphosphatase [Paludifilum halophilum]OYD09652.1 acylphosphatase [Paludifilum halophilum]
MIRNHIIVHGRVQGVGFRYYTQRIAAQYRMVGWVRNKADGTVEIDAQGDKEQMDSFLRAVKKGSPHSKVTQIDIDQGLELKKYRSFQIQY